jgi:hypothetical protein
MPERKTRTTKTIKRVRRARNFAKIIFSLLSDLIIRKLKLPSSISPETMEEVKTINTI